jgi:hypothetical protein
MTVFLSTLIVFTSMMGLLLWVQSSRARRQGPDSSGIGSCRGDCPGPCGRHGKGDRHER